MLLENKPSSKNLKALQPVLNQGSQAALSAHNLPSQPKLNWWQKRSLGTKATILGILLGTLPVVVVGAITYNVVSESILQQALEREKEGVKELSDKLNRFMFERYGDIQTLASFELFTDPSLKISEQRKANVLERFITTYGVYNNIAVINLDGSIKFDNTTSKTERSFNFKKQEIDYFLDVLKNDQPVIGYPRFSKITGKFSLFAAAPVKVAGITSGVIRTRIPLEKVAEVAELAEAGGQKFILIEPRENKVFSASDPEDFDKNAVAKLPFLEQSPATPEAQARVATIDGQDQVVAYVKSTELKGLPNLNWTVALYLPTEIALAAQRELLTSVSVGTAMAAVAAGILAALIANRATRPVAAAAAAVVKIGQGDLDTRLGVEGADELAQLGTNINLMAGQIENLLEAQKQETERASLLTTIALKIRETLDLDLICTRIVNEAQAALQCDRVVIYRFNPDFSGYISHEAVLPGLPRAVEDLMGDPCIPTETMEAYKKGRVVPTNDVTEPGYHPDHMALLNRLKVKSNLVTPIVQGQDLFGLLVAHHCQSTHLWQASEVSFLSQLATQTGTAIEQSQFVERLEIARREARSEADARADQQRQEKESLQRRALELLIEVDPVSRGDLTVRANVTEDELGTIADSYNSLIRSLRGIVAQVKSASQAVAANTQDSEETVKVVAQEALQQAEAIREALEQIQVMTSSIKGVENRAEQAAQAMIQANQVVKAGDAAMNKTVAGISAIQDTVTEAVDQVKQLDQASQKISKVVKLIGGFAAQTNLLALNASIEAARAGEEGEGFGVVANEVRALAQRSATATNEIRFLVEEIQSQIQKVVQAMETSTAQVSAGTKLVEQSREQLSLITTMNSQVNQLVQEIARAATVQAQTSTNVSTKIQTVSAIATQASKQTEQVAESFSDLKAVAEKLQTSVAQFKV
ncbi:MAG: methyl-accepting chemotaxis protein [Pseudanabaenaceae cyanobacterium bins.68]|nr:methyl-accepting chemotaxis protein [Pseudanabaenaceae cyanobacterium bins.68]